MIAAIVTIGFVGWGDMATGASCRYGAVLDRGAAPILHDIVSSRLSAEDPPSGVEA